MLSTLTLKLKIVLLSLLIVVGLITLGFTAYFQLHQYDDIVIAAASDEINNTAQSFARGASIQAASVEVTSSAMEQMSASIRKQLTISSFK